MIRTSDVASGQVGMFIKALAIGETGSGKTYFASTFPKSYFLMTEPNGEDTFLTMPTLRVNVVGFDRFIPESAKDTKRVFDELKKATLEARQLAKDKQIETVVLDNITYLAEYRWMYINEFEKEVSKSTGEPNTMAMYGKLNRWLNEFVIQDLLTIPANLIVTVHQMLESDEALEKKPDKSNPVMPSILGGFRDTIGGLFSHILYLAKKEAGGKYQYVARTNLGQGKNAKSRFPNMPPVIENISYATFKDTIVKCLSENINQPK
ncbi:MAG: AAA family ATPase [Candidatus Paceibacterota bacterium]